MLEQWFESDRGKKILGRQQEMIDEILTRCFGYHLLQLSVSARIKLYENSRVQSNYLCHPFSTGSHARCNFDRLPFANESLDAVIIHHAHEFVGQPHQLLRELQRVVIPHGHLIIAGFNPWSPLGFYSRMSHLLPRSMWQNHSISSRRIKDWLNLLGFETQVNLFGYHSPQLLERTGKPFFNRWLRRWPLGAFYLISAVKEEATMTPVKPVWRSSQSGFSGLAPVKRRITNSRFIDRRVISTLYDENII
jgi:SAM-dependent methyltransferase